MHGQGGGFNERAFVVPAKTLIKMTPTDKNYVFPKIGKKWQNLVRKLTEYWHF